MIKDLIKILDFPSLIEQELRNKYVTQESEIKEIAKTAYLIKDEKFLLCNQKPLTRLLVVIYLLFEKYEDYKKKNVSDDIIVETFKDVSLRAKNYYELNKQIGISNDDVMWFRHIMNVNIYKIGCLQFQPFEMIYLDEEFLGEPYMKFTIKQKENLPSNTPVINCHIQKGSNIELNKMKESITEARVFFKNIYPETNFKAFICYSWLLYPKMQKLLSDNSNIKQFANLFTIIGECDDNEQALENLFNKNYKQEGLNNLTSLQVNAIKYPKEFGFACGIIEF